MEEKKIDFSAIEKKWQKAWEKKKIFEVSENSKKKKYYVLEMYPYPSASYLHMGHVRNFTIGDVYARYKRMQGWNVLYPMGYDSFGLPAETAAKKEGIHPKKYTEDAIKKIMEYFKALGNSYDWSRTLASHEPDYYKWNQYFFLKFFEKGLAYRKKAPVNFCPNCESVLANEEAENGKCWRCNQEVVQKDMEQWFYKITSYADRLLDDLKKIDWPERIKVMQENWVGKSQGINIDFSINNRKWHIFTTRPDTIYGVTFMVVSSKHPRLMELVTENQKKSVREFLEKIKNSSEEELEEMEKQGVFTGSYAVNPLTNEKIPVYAGNFVVADYGSGMVMAVPSHDQRDWEFAKKYKILMKEVIKGGDINKEAYTNEGVLVNSQQFSGLDSREAIRKISDYIEHNNLGKKTTNYKIRDWMISRQRYWGTPIPIIYCDNCGIQAVPEKDLPVLLPEKVDFKTAGNPLATNREWINVKCPKCGKLARRETDTMGGFVDSSWYFLRYCDPENKKFSGSLNSKRIQDNKNKLEPFDSKKVKYWMPVDQYIGGAEHAVMHLMYARFFIKALKDLGFVNFDEPFLKLFNQGIVYKDGNKMSKSKGNVVFQTDISNKYGIDTARLFLMFVSSPDKQMEWSNEGVEGAFRIVNRFVRLARKVKNIKNDARTESKLNLTIKEASENIDNFNYPKAIISISEFSDYLDSKNEIPKSAFEALLKMFSVFCPHISEEIWSRLGNKTFISLESWPEADEKKINPELEQEEKQVEKLINDIRNILKILESRGESRKKKIMIFAIPKELDLYKKAKEQIERAVNIKTEILSIQEAGRTGKKIKAVPGKPGIFIE